MKATLTAAALALLTLPAAAQSLSGSARVIDGDTIVIGITHIRLQGLTLRSYQWRMGSSQKQLCKP